MGRRKRGDPGYPPTPGTGNGMGVGVGRLGDGTEGRLQQPMTPGEFGCGARALLRRRAVTLTLVARWLLSYLVRYSARAESDPPA